VTSPVERYGVRRGRPGAADCGVSFWTTMRSSARGVRDLLEAEGGHHGDRRGPETASLGAGPDPRAEAGRGPSLTCGCRTATGCRCAGRSAPGCPRWPASCLLSVRRRRGAIRRDHGGCGRVRAQADTRAPTWSAAVRTVASGQSMLDPAARASQLMARLRDQSAKHDPLAGLSNPGAQDPGAHRGRADQPADRRADVPGREDREELCVRAVSPRLGMERRTPGGRLRGPRVRRPPRRPRALPGSRKLGTFFPGRQPPPGGAGFASMYSERPHAPEACPGDECFTLMASVPVGRIIYTRRALPAVELVNFAFDHGGHRDQDRPQRQSSPPPPAAPSSRSRPTS